MRRLIVLFALVGAVVAAGPAYGAINVEITSPTDGAHSLAGVVPVAITASADNGVYAVQLKVDGAAYGTWDLTPTDPYRYQIDWDTSGLTPGDHVLTATALDWSQPYPLGAQADSAPVTVDVGPAYPTIALTSPPAWTTVRGAVTLAETHTSAVDPATVALTVDGAPATSPWDTTTVPDGAHTVVATITDGRGKQASSSATVAVDNTPPTTYVTVPAANAYATGSLPVQAHASDAHGIASVQFRLDGVDAGPPVTQPDSSGGYTYSATLDLAGLTGVHRVTSVATDEAGNTTTSAPVSFTVGAKPLAVLVVTPPDWGYARDVVTVTGTVDGGTAPYTVTMLVDGQASGVPVVSATPSFAWSTKTATDGSHTVALRVTDADGKTATSPSVHATVDNSVPVAVVYQPAAGSRIAGAASLQVHASDAYGVKSVQFTVDGNPVGALLTAPDAGQAYLYTISYDTTALPAGTHDVSAIVTDNAGNTTTPKAVSIVTGPLSYLPVLNYHGIDPADGMSIYDQTAAQADAELAFLKANGYQSVTLEQYQAWVATGSLPAGVTKPILITVDDGLADELAWDGLLQKYGFTAVMFVITGYVDNTTPGDADPVNNLTWAQIQALATNGRWQIAFHGGKYGHGDDYTVSKIGLASYTAACPYFYTCLNRTKIGRLTINETVPAYKLAVTSEVTAGIAELRAKVPTASLAAWAAPFNDAGQWTNLYNDPSGAVQSWFPGFMASKFPIVFMQTNPVTYAQASGTVGALTAFNRRYRFEVHTDTSLDQLNAALTDPAFAR